MPPILYASVQLAQSRYHASRKDGTAYVGVTVWYLSGDECGDLVLDKEISTCVITHGRLAWPKGYVKGVQVLMTLVENVEYRGMTVEIPYENAVKWVHNGWKAESEVGLYFKAFSKQSSIRFTGDVTDLGTKLKGHCEHVAKSNGYPFSGVRHRLRLPNTCWWDIEDEGTEDGSVELVASVKKEGEVTEFWNSFKG